MANATHVYGYIEKATLVDKHLTLAARLDTGAKSASLNARNIREVSIHGKPYLTFVVPSREGDVPFTCEYIGKVKIKLRDSEVGERSLLRTAAARPMVFMSIKMGRTTRIIRVNLANRQRFIYPLLLGREAIKLFNGVVDPSLKYTQAVEKI
jgi:hypothetical protein